MFQRVVVPQDMTAILERKLIVRMCIIEARYCWVVGLEVEEVQRVGERIEFFPDCGPIYFVFLLRYRSTNLRSLLDRGYEEGMCLISTIF